MCDSLGQSDQKITAYELTMFGQTVVYRNRDEMLMAIKLDSEDCEKVKIKIKAVEMYEHEFDQLPEFEGY